MTKEIKAESIADVLVDTFKVYAKYVIQDRALPDVRDGLKPAQRRLLWTMYLLKALSNSQHRKSAKIAGECFVAGELVHTPEGLVPIEDLNIGDAIYTEGGNISSVVEVYKNPPAELVEVTFENGVAMKVTPGQLFRVLDANYETKWCRADELEGCLVLTTKGHEIDIDVPSEADTQLAYTCGLMSAEGWKADRGSNGYAVQIGMTDIEPIKAVQSFVESTGISREIRKRGTQEGFKDLYTLQFTAKHLEPVYAACLERSEKKTIPTEILNNKNMFAPYIAGLIDGDGHIKKADVREIVITTISRRLAKQVHAILGFCGISGSINKEKENTESYSTTYVITVTGDAAQNLAKLVLGYSELPRKKAALRKLVNWNRPERSYKESRVPARYIFEEFSSHHLGGGWYADKNGKKFRAGIKYPNGIKIRYSADLKEKDISTRTIETLGILDKLERLGSPLYVHLSNLCANYRVLKVKSILPTQPEETYDVQIADASHQIMVQGVVCSNCMGSFHPHGSAYGTLANMAQDWVFNAPLVDGKGNFGSLDGDSPAADRYTEARLSKYSDMVFFPRRLKEEEEIVPFTPNYDNTQKEPVVFPAVLPNIIVNGATGIAVGMATDIPPFNLGEVCDALISIIEGKNSFEDIIKVLPAPDLPTGGILEADKSELKQIYELGRGRLRLRGKVYIVHNERGANLIINEIPYGLNKKSLLENLFEKTQFSVKTVKDPRTGAKSEKKIEPVIKGVKSVEDFSGGENGPVHIAVEIAPGHDPKKVANQLLKETKLEGTINPNITVIVNKKPIQTGILGLLNYFIKFRQATIRKEFAYEKEQAEYRSHILDGRLIAYTNKDKVLRIIHGTPTVEEEKAKLAKEFGLSDIQINDIRSLPQYAFKKVEVAQVKEELKDKKNFIAYANKILRSRAELDNYMKEQILELKKTLAVERKTLLEDKFTEIQDLDTVTKQDVVLLVSSDNTVKTTPIEEYRIQRKGGKGALGISVKEGVQVKFMGQVSTHDTVWIVTDMGNRYILPIRYILPTPKTKKSKPIENYVPAFDPSERIVDAIVVNAGTEDKYIVIINEEGMIKRMSMQDLMTKRATTTQIFPVDTARIVSAKVMDEESDVFITSANGQGLRFPLNVLRTVQSLAAGGVQSITLADDDYIVGLSSITLGDELLFVSDTGYAKRVLEGDIARKKGKVGIGVRVNPENAGRLILAEIIFGDQLIMITSDGRAIRINIDEIGTYRRTARGQRIQKMGKGEDVVAAAQINTNIVES